MTLSSIGKFGTRLIAPHPSVTDLEQKHQIRLLSCVYLAIAFLGLFQTVVRSFPETVSGSRTLQSFVTGSVFPVLSVIGIYLLTRSRFHRIAAWICVSVLFVAAHGGYFFQTGNLGWTMYTILPLLAASILFSWKGVLAVGAGSVLIQLLVKPNPNTPLSITATSMVQIISYAAAFATIVVIYRNNLERARQKELTIANERLRESELSLEKRVLDRTRDLEIAASVSRQITTILDLNLLLQDVAEKTRSGFQLDHVSVFLFNPDTGQLSLEAGSGQVGQQMKAQEKSFNVQTDNALVAEAARRQQAVLVGDVTQDKRYFANPLLPATRSELSLPMLLGGRLIGVLDLQASQLNRFSEDDVRIIQSLAEQIAIAVENAHLFNQQATFVERLRALDQMKSQFLASMSHELRTPLNAILNFTEFVAVGLFGEVNEKQKDALDKSLDSGKHLLSLINDVLDMTKIESGMMKLFVEENINLHEELKPVVASVQTLLKDRTVTFVEAVDTDLPIMIGDKRRIRQILLNLLSNAAKFTEQGSITLTVKNQGDEVLFCVADTGPGIAPEDQGVIFEPFKQTQTGIRHANGTGLGLPISRRLAEAHGGRLWVESQPGQGATFYVALPSQSPELLKQMQVNTEMVHA
jgi:signal transduction histidine kinase